MKCDKEGLVGVKVYLPATKRFETCVVDGVAMMASSVIKKFDAERSLGQVKTLHADITSPTEKSMSTHKCRALSRHGF